MRDNVGALLGFSFIDMWHLLLLKGRLPTFYIYVEHESKYFVDSQDRFNSISRTYPRQTLVITFVSTRRLLSYTVS